MFPFGSRLAPPPRLPRPIPPFAGETTRSYLYRLAVANHIPPETLRAHLAGSRRHAPITLDAVAAATGRLSNSLHHALPELRPEITAGADPVLPAHVRRTVCYRCALHRGAFAFAVIWRPAEVALCPNHLIWLGPPVRSYPGNQYNVADLPDILQAQRRHYRLARRYGRNTAADVVTEAAHITARWARHGLHGDRRRPLLHAFGHRSLTGKLLSSEPITPLVTYPETIDLARVLAMPRWRHPTAPTSGNELLHFRDDINQHLGIRYHPRASHHDLLMRWFQTHHYPPHGRGVEGLDQQEPSDLLAERDLAVHDHKTPATERPREEAYGPNLAQSDGLPHDQ